VQPETRYAKSGDVHIAYQVLGDGPRDLVYLSSWDFAIDFHWDEPRQVQFFRQLASFSRVIFFDKRGTGASDSVSLDAMPTLESWVDDVRVVMDAVGSERAAVLTPTWAGPLAILFAATCPERTSALILVHIWARLRYAPDYPYGLPDERIDEIMSVIEKEWGTGNLWARVEPSLADDERLRRWWNRCHRLSISPATAVAFTTMMANSDVRSVLPVIQCPTLVVTGDHPFRPAAFGHYLAQHIPDATCRVVEGSGTLPWLCDTLAGDIEEFLTGVRPVPESDRVLATVLFTDIVGSTERAAALGDRAWRALLDAHHEIARRQLERHRGREIEFVGDGLFATFDGPARAIRCAFAIMGAVRTLGLEIRAGLHTGEVELAGSAVRGIAVHIGARVAAEAGAGEVLVSSTVKDLVAGSGIRFADRDLRVLKGVPGEWHLYAADYQQAI